MYKSKHYSISGELLTLEQAANITNLGIATIRKLVKESGAGLKIGKSFRVDRQKLLDYIRQFKSITKED